MNISHDKSYAHPFSCVVALGCFDGVHKGHTAVIGKAIQRAKELSLPSCIWSFAEPPKRFYNPNDVPLLTSLEEKERIIKELGADICISVKFDNSIASLSPNEFFESFLINNLHAKCIVCGYEFSFGKGGTGNAQTLKELCKRYDIELITHSQVYEDGISVSSSHIRKCISEGDVRQAAKLLGRNYAIASEIVSGKHLGRNLGFPTINQHIDKGMCIPAHGVYLTKISVDGDTFDGITNVGTQPTVGGTEIVCETNIFNYSGDLYGKYARVEFVDFIRPEKKFSSIDELSAQVHADIEMAIKTINK